MVVIRSLIGIPDHFSTFVIIQNRGFQGDLLAFLIQSPVDFSDTGLSKDADKIMNPHFAAIRIRISPEIWIRIPNQFWLTLCVLAEPVLAEHGLG